MAPIREALEAAAVASFCTVTAPAERTISIAENWINNRNLPGYPGGPTPIGQAMRAARNVLCGVPPDDISSEFDPPFTGGQCPGTIYNTQTQAFLNGSPIGGVQNSSGPGPISLVRDYNPDTNFQSIDLFDANGTSLGGIGSGAQNDIDLQVISISPQAGQPDNCGDPGPDIVPYIPDNFTDTPDVTYTPPDGPDITIPIPIVFAPVKVDVDGRVTIPTRFEFSPDVFLDAEIDLSDNNVNFNVDIDTTLPTDVDDPTVLDDPEGTPGIPETEETEIERSIIAVYVKTTNIADSYEGTQIPTAAAGSEMFVPRLASVSFLCEILSSPGLAYTIDLDVKMTEQIIPCPVPWGAKGVVVTAQDGITVATTLIRGESRRDLWLSAAGVE